MEGRVAVECQTINDSRLLHVCFKKPLKHDPSKLGSNYQGGIYRFIEFNKITNAFME
jgi:hypothetical protein